LKKNILFVINPISGGKSKLNFAEKVFKYLNLNLFDPSFEFTQWHGHGIELTRKAVDDGFDIVVAVGGDGTINEIASVLEGTKLAMGIVPYGSGNGLARSLNIPMNEINAIKRLNDLKFQAVDSGLFNGRKFFNIAGVGFDALISARFAENVKRGLFGYLKTIFFEISAYKAQNYKIEIDGRLIEREAFMISLANSSQFGNNAHIAPFASLTDGFLDICIIKPFPVYKAFFLGIRMFTKSTHKCNFVEILSARNIKITRENVAEVHLDGEPIQMGLELNISIKPLSLIVLN
jgi:YegS/Rv2252/BmrU family lipid kinase